jgi:tripartite-type tricarboxylate transporter receptor subunit TctC
MTFIFNTLRSLTALTLAAFTAVAIAQTNYPSRPIKIVVPYAAGGGADQVTRLMGLRLADRLKQSVWPWWPKHRPTVTPLAWSRRRS